MRDVLKLINDSGLILNLSKCNFFYTEVDFLGFEVSENGIRPESRKTAAISDFPIPKNVHEVRQFIGLVSFFRRFIKDFALIPGGKVGFVSDFTNGAAPRQL